MQRTDLTKEKMGVELKEIKAVNPFNNEELPVWVADYVLGGYGTGAGMTCRRTMSGIGISPRDMICRLKW